MAGWDRRGRSGAGAPAPTGVQSQTYSFVPIFIEGPQGFKVYQYAHVEVYWISIHIEPRWWCYYRCDTCPHSPGTSSSSAIVVTYRQGPRYHGAREATRPYTTSRCETIREVDIEQNPKHKGTYQGVWELGSRAVVGRSQTLGLWVVRSCVYWGCSTEPVKD